MAGPIPPPVPGQVIRYSYLWADESERGVEEGRKDRPSLVLALAVSAAGGVTQVLVLAITHAAPRAPGDAMPLPDAVKRRLGLDDAPSWIVVSEANAFVWPGPDLRPVPGRTPRTHVYGSIPRELLAEVARAYLARARAGGTRRVPRTR
jgi:hypothetical protein